MERAAESPSGSAYLRARGRVPPWLGVTTTLVGRQLTRHRGLLAEPGYAARLVVLGSQCLDRAHPASRYANTPRP